MNSALKKLGIALLAIVLCIAGLLAYFTIFEYKPDDIVNIEVASGEKIIEKDNELSIMTFNTGYGGLDEAQDFFMDGGEGVEPESEEIVRRNVDGIGKSIVELDTDFTFLQEVDVDSKRTYHVNELEISEEMTGEDGVYAPNHKANFVPYPIPPIGEIDAGLATLTDYKMSSAKRIALPISFKWPVSTCNLKRCMLETRMPIEGSDKELVLINFHLEAYDSGEGKIAQSKMLAKKLEEEYEKGNYVIAGGDFNQTFEGMDTYPIHDKEGWVPGIIGKKEIGEDFSFAVSDNEPTCRLLNGPYSGNFEDSQVYVIDGFIVSKNIEVTNVKNIRTEFKYSDHQPVLMNFKLK